MSRLMTDKHEHFRRRLAEMNGGTLGARMGIEFVEVTPERIVARMPVAGNTQPFGLLHGGASVVLAETLGSVGAMMHAGEGRIAVGIEINATHHRAARAGFVTGTATPHWATPSRPMTSSSSTRTANGCAPPGSPA